MCDALRHGSAHLSRRLLIIGCLIYAYLACHIQVSRILHCGGQYLVCRLREAKR